MSSSSDIAGRGITLLLAVGGTVPLDAVRSWRATLIVSELINNACRHAFGTRSGRISIAIHGASDRIVCQVSDDGDGSAFPGFNPGLGTRLVNALATELGGSVERRFTDFGTTVTLSFPKDGIDLPLQRLDGRNGEEVNWGRDQATKQDRATECTAMSIIAPPPARALSKCQAECGMPMPSQAFTRKTLPMAPFSTICLAS